MSKVEPLRREHDTGNEPMVRAQAVYTELCVLSANHELTPEEYEILAALMVGAVAHANGRTAPRGPLYNRRYEDTVARVCGNARRWADDGAFS